MTYHCTAYHGISVRVEQPAEEEASAGDCETDALHRPPAKDIGTECQQVSRNVNKVDQYYAVIHVR